MNQAASAEKDDLAARLRKIRQNRAITTQAMAEATGIPKRSLESYMLKQNAAAPGIEALSKLSVGLEVSLDWLVFGGQDLGLDQSRLVRVAARAALLPMLNSIVKNYRRGSETAFETDTIFGLLPQELAAEIATDAGDRARALAEGGNDRGQAIKVGESAMNRRDGV